MRTYCIALETLLSALGDLNEKDLQKEGVYVYAWLIHFAVQQKLTQHCKAIILHLYIYIYI